MSTYLHQLPVELTIIIGNYLRSDFFYQGELIFSQDQYMIKLKEPQIYDVVYAYSRIHGMSLYEWIVVRDNLDLLKEYLTIGDVKKRLKRIKNSGNIKYTRSVIKDI